MKKRLTRSSKHNLIAGICGGIAEYFDWDPTIVRVLYIVISILSVGFPGTLVYVILWFVIPMDTATDADNNRLTP